MDMSKGKREEPHMQYDVDFDIDSFEFWGGARDRMDGATDEQREEVAERIEEYLSCPDGRMPTETDINDLVWFECDDILFPEEEEEEEE